MSRGGPDQGPGRRVAILKLTILVLLLVGGVLAVRVTPLAEILSREGVGEAIDRLRGSVWAPVIFVAVYAGATALAVPGTVLTLAGGALFGFLWGTVYNSIAANIGANLAFLVARFLGRDAVETLTGDRLAKLDRATAAHGFRGLLTLRLIPLVPFNALNFSSGLTALSWPTYAGATLVGILPGTIVYTMFADALLAGSREASREALIRVLVSGGLLVLLSFLPTLLRRMGIRLPGASVLLAAAAVPMWAVSPPGPLVASPAVDAVRPGSGGIRAAPATLSGPAFDGPGSRQLPHHDAFTRVLREVVRGARVDYRRLQEHRSPLDDYLAALAGVPAARLRSAPRHARLAFWINAYNACMLRLVADHYPIEATSGLLGRLRNAIAGRPANSVWQIDDPFTRAHCPVAGETRSQDEIEHDILRPMGDPRIHFAVNCAAVSCPPLIPEAYTAERVDAQLDGRVQAFVDDPRHFRLVREGDPALHLNRVLDWYRDDFGGVDGIRTFFEAYVTPDVGEVIADPGTEVSFMEYDWTLNDVPR